MKLEVTAASAAHIDFAWSIFGPFIRSNLFSGAAGAKSPDDWDDGAEYSKFTGSWSATDQFIITVDEEPIGWVSTSRNDGGLQIDNLMISPEWRNRKVASTILSELSRNWKEQGLSVRANILEEAESTDVAKKLAKKVGASAVDKSDRSTVFQLN